MRFGGTSTRAHRIAWQIAYGPIPAGLLVLHTCDNPGCVNPVHLYIGTQKDNMRDMSIRGYAKNRKKRVDFTDKFWYY